jgi:hypothetical protein
VAAQVHLKPVSGWQRTNVLVGAEYLRGILERTPGDMAARVAYEMLLEVLEPARRSGRLSVARAVVAERRAMADRRRQERRQFGVAAAHVAEKRVGHRRTGPDRRNR